jgi:hypothetical protein
MSHQYPRSLLPPQIKGERAARNAWQYRDGAPMIVAFHGVSMRDDGRRGDVWRCGSMRIVEAQQLPTSTTCFARKVQLLRPYFDDATMIASSRTGMLV